MNKPELCYHEKGNGDGRSKRDRQVIRFLEWVKRHPGWWELICTPNHEHMKLTMMKMLVERLAKEQFYELIFVMLMVHRKAGFVDSVMKDMLLEMILAGWKGKVKGKEESIADLIDFLT